MPDVFQPPIGAVVHIRVEITSLTLTAPQSSCTATAFARSMSLENTEPDSPYGLSFASRLASSTDDTFMIGSVGPNVSSVMHAIEWLTSTNTVGGEKLPGPLGPWPPVSTFAPLALASAT